MADQNITALPVATTPESSDQILLVGATEEKLIDYDKLADAILGKIASKNFALNQGNKTLLQALNELNSKTVSINTDNAKSFITANKRAWIFLYTLGTSGNDGNYGIFLYTPSYSGIPTVRSIIRNSTDFTLSAKISNDYAEFESSRMYLQGFVLYCQ